MDYKVYIEKYFYDKTIFKRFDVKKDIISNPSRHVITWFCTDNSVTSSMINDLLDEVGIKLLHESDDYLSRVNGIISSSKDISKLYDNVEFLQMLTELNDYYYYLNDICAFKFINYCISYNPSNIVNVYKKLSSEAQTYVINNCDLGEYYYELLIYSKGSSVSILLDKISSLNGYDYSSLVKIFSNDVHIPERLLDSDFIKKISTMYNVKQYRTIIFELAKNNDVSFIEDLRRKYYDDFLDNCSIIYENIDRDIRSGSNFYNVFNKYLNCFGGLDLVISGFDYSSKAFELIKKSMNYITTGVVVDYLFQDNCYNLFLDMKELLHFSSSTNLLSDSDVKMYSDIISLDSMSVSEKKELLNSLKKTNISHKYYDDYLKARNMMTNLFNCSILNKDNIIQFKNNELSKQYGVPIYELCGQEFYVLVKALNIRRDEVLDSKNLFSSVAGSSFSIDGSGKLKVFNDISEYYSLVYNMIPWQQLIHVFEVDSFSKYFRNNKNLPLDYNGTNRINRLYTPKQLFDASTSYSELVLSQPINSDDEFNNLLVKPVPYAIYCYNNITDMDIESAKNTGLGIIVVKTNNYDVHYSSTVGILTRDDRDISYINPFVDDDTYNRKL